MLKINSNKNIVKNKFNKKKLKKIKLILKKKKLIFIKKLEKKS